MDSGDSELLKAWHMLQKPIGIEPGIHGPVSHVAATVIDVAIKRAERNVPAVPKAQNSGCRKTETGAEV